MKNKVDLTGIVILILSCFVSSLYASSNYICEDAGRFQLPDNGNGYVDCISNDNGELTVHREIDCGAFPYSNYLQNCDYKHPTEQGNFFDLIEEFDLVRNESFDSYCISNTMPNLCYSCDKKIQCISGQAYLEFCFPGETCTEDQNFGGGICLPYSITVTMSDDCDCPRFGFTDDGFNDRCYLFCDTTTNPPTIEFYECPPDQIFENGVCKSGLPYGCYSPAPELPNCTTMGTFVHPEECSYYYACIPDGSEGFQAKQYCCEDPITFFDEETGLCENVCDLLAGSASPDFICPGEGIFMDPYQCDVYYDCFGEGQAPFKEHKCPEGTYYNDKIHVCDAEKPANCLQTGVDYTDCPRLDVVTEVAGCKLGTTVTAASTSTTTTPGSTVKLLDF